MKPQGSKSSVLTSFLNLTTIEKTKADTALGSVLYFGTPHEKLVLSFAEFGYNGVVARKMIEKNPWRSIQSNEQIFFHAQQGYESVDTLEKLNRDNFVVSFSSLGGSVIIYVVSISDMKCKYSLRFNFTACGLYTKQRCVRLNGSRILVVSGKNMEYAVVRFGQKAILERKLTHESVVTRKNGSPICCRYCKSHLYEHSFYVFGDNAFQRIDFETQYSDTFMIRTEKNWKSHTLSVCGTVNSFLSPVDKNREIIIVGSEKCIRVFQITKGIEPTFSERFFRLDDGLFYAQIIIGKKYMISGDDFGMFSLHELQFSKKPNDEDFVNCEKMMETRLAYNAIRGFAVYGDISKSTKILISSEDRYLRLCQVHGMTYLGLSELEEFDKEDISYRLSYLVEEDDSDVGWEVGRYMKIKFRNMEITKVFRSLLG